MASYKKNKSMKTIFTILALLCSTSLHFAQIKDFHLDQEYAIAKDGTIDLRCSDAKVTVIGTNRTALAHVKIDRTVVTKGWYATKGFFTVDVEANEGNLIIRERQSSQSTVMFGYISEEYTIKLEVPTGASLTIKGDDGNYYITNLKGIIKLDVDDGDVSLTQCKGSDFSFDLNDGRLKMDGGSGFLRINANDSDLEFSECSFTSIDADVADGDLILQSSITDTGNYTLRTQDGLLIFDVLTGGGIFSIRHNDARIHTQGNISSKQESENFTELEVGKGQAKVNIRSNDGSVRLKSSN